MERNKLEGLGRDIKFDNEVVLSEISIEEIQWWYQNVRSKNGKRIRPVKPQKQCRTDASFQGWGAIDFNSNEYTQGRWNISESDHSINYFELLAVCYGLQSLYGGKHDMHIQV